jgi:hypothetical protein
MRVACVVAGLVIRVLAVSRVQWSWFRAASGGGRWRAVADSSVQGAQQSVISKRAGQQRAT